MWKRLQWSTDSNALEKSGKIMSTWVMSLKASQIKQKEIKELVVVEQPGKSHVGK